jgi:radical SAM protein with 4Fe4S-binding SPASM domain
MDNGKFDIKELDFPRMVVLSVTYACNSHCPSCPYTNSGIRKNYKDAMFMPTNLFEKIARECGKHKAVIRLTGGGEPLLHPHMLDMIEYARLQGAKIGLITNGSLLTPMTVDRLLACGTDAIEISADAADKETYEKIRVGLDFDRLLVNVRYLMDRRNETKSKTKVIVSLVNQKALDGKLEQAKEFWEKIVDNVQVRKYLTWSINDAGQSADPEPLMKDRVPCPYPFERIVIDSRGKTIFCSYDIAGETDFGNVNDQSIRNIWQGEKLTAWRKLLLEGQYEQIDICKKCPDWRYRSWNYNYWKIMDEAEKKRVAGVIDG